MIGTRLKQLREEQNLKQEELAQKLSISASAVGMYETNKREPNNELTVKIAEFFGVTTDYLLGKTEIRNSEEANFKFAFHKDIDTEGLTDEDIKEALEIYRMIKNREKKEDK